MVRDLGSDAHDFVSSRERNDANMDATVNPVLDVEQDGHLAQQEDDKSVDLTGNHVPRITVIHHSST